MKKTTKSCLELFLIAMIWGGAFVAQSEGMAYVGPLTMQAVRFFLAGLVLLPVIALSDKKGLTQNRPVTKQEKTRCLTAGLVCGLVLFGGSTFQQYGIVYTTVGKSGFITALYIILVPIAGLFLKKPAGLKTWCSVAVSLAGLYFLCLRGATGINKGDLLTFCCAVCFTAHILYIDSVGGAVDGLRMSCIQFFTCSLLSAVGMLVFETPSWPAIVSCAPLILYTGVLSSAVGYTLQIVAQRDAPPVLASIILSLESVFAVLFGWLLIGQKLTGWEILGCALMFCATILAQIPTRAERERVYNE